MHWPLNEDSCLQNLVCANCMTFFSVNLIRFTKADEKFIIQGQYV